MFLGFVFEQVREAVELPAVEFLVSTLAPVSSVTVLVFTNLAQVTDSDATNLVVDTLLYDAFGEGVKKVVFPSGQLLSSAKRTARRTVFPFGVVLVSREVVLVLFQHVSGVQFGVTVIVGDGEVVLDTEVNTCRVVAGSILDGDFDLTDEVELPAVAVPHGSYLLDVLHGYVGSRFVLTEDEVRAVALQVEPLAQTKLGVFGIVLDTLLLPRDGGAWVFVAVFPVAGWVGVLVSALACFIPTSERLSKLFENSLT